MTKTIKGFLIFKGPVYRGNSRKTIFTRGESRTDIRLPGKIGGSAQALMSAFTGSWKHRSNPSKSNYGLLERLWKRLYKEDMPGFITNVSCNLVKEEAEPDPQFDLRMGIALDRDTMTQAKDQNFRLETLCNGSRFDFRLSIDENRMDSQKKIKFNYLMEEMVQGRFWFGAKKSTGLGGCFLKLDRASQDLLAGYKSIGSNNIRLNPSANYLFIHLNITPDNGMLVSWPWGKKDERSNRDTWIDDLSKETEEHKAVMKSVLSGEARTWSDIEKMPGGMKFKNNHQDNRGRPMDLRQLKRNFPKAVKNDDTLIDFLCGFREKAHTEIDRRPHLDFREQNGTIVRGKEYDQLFNRSLTWDSGKTTWELSIPGNTIKGAFRTKAQQILRTLKNGKGCSEKTGSHRGGSCDDRNCPVCSLFGRQNQIAKVFCSDAFLEADDLLLNDEHFSYDQIGIDPKTGKTIDSSKLNFLYAYGPKFTFRSTLVLQDIDFQNPGQLGFLMYLLKEFESGAVPFGGKKTMGFGYVQGKVEKMEVLCGEGSSTEKQVNRWGGESTEADNLWKRYELKDIWKKEAFTKDMEKGFSGLIGKIEVPVSPFKTQAGFVSHRQHSSLCGTLIYELEALTPLNIKESGEPSYQGEDTFGYDFFSISTPRNDRRQPIGSREYAIPPTSIKGLVRNTYNLISKNPCPGCSSINRLCDTCRLFGFVGNEALMGRLRFGFARPAEALAFEWVGVAFGYKGEKSHSVAGNRIFPHTNHPNNAISRHGSGGTPDNVINNITLNRFASTGSKFQFQVDFTNLEKGEFNKILWAIGLEDGLAHKLGNGKALGFGRCKISLKDAYIINWEDRFSSLSNSGIGYLNLEKLKADPENFANYDVLKQALSVPGGAL